MVLWRVDFERRVLWDEATESGRWREEEGVEGVRGRVWELENGRGKEGTALFGRPGEG